MDTYLDLINNVQGLEYTSLWKIFLLGFFRFAPIIAIAPFLGAKLIPNMARAGLAIMLTAIFLPIILTTNKSLYVSNDAFVVLALKELIIGTFLGYLSSVPFFIAQSSGIYVDYLRGSSMMMAQDPTTQAQSSSIGIMLNYFLIAVFYMIDGDLFFFDAVATSFQILPVDGHIDMSMFINLNNPFWQTMIGLLHKVFEISLQLAAPPLLAVLMAEVFLGIANRLAPQVQIAFLGMSLKSLLGLTLLWAGWYFIIFNLAKISSDWIRTITTIINDLQPFSS